MTTVADYFKQSELALAAYADLAFGSPDPQKLRDVDMTESQALNFAASWSVITQYTDPITGVSATVFQEISTGQITLAIRGTQASGADLTADGLLALGLPSNLNPQFTALKAQLDIWLADPSVLKDQSFTVSGHSLGGYLAAAVKQTYPQVTDAYLFNAPGVGGVLGNLSDALTSTLGLSGAPTGNIWNVRSSEGFPIIAGLGYQLGTAISIQAEAAVNPLNNHSIVTLTDALAVQSLYSRLSPSLSQERLNALIDASGATMDQTLESALDALRTILLGPNTSKTAIGDRNAYYTNLYSLTSNSHFTALAGTAQLTVLADLSSDGMVILAKTNGAQGLAARYALDALSPFVLTGADYSAFNTGGALERYDPATGTGAITDRYLTDRAAFLERKIRFSTQDKNPVDPSIVFDSNNHPFQNESAYYADVATGYKIQQGGLYDNTHRYFFGGSGNDTYSGSKVEDHLYGGAGNDILTGGQGNDYLEGGAGNDTYVVNAGDGYDTVLDSDGAGVVKFGAVEAKGSVALSDPTKWKQLTPDTWADTQNGITYLRSVVDGETRLLVKKGDGSALVKDWSDGELGITLGAGAPLAPPPTVLTGTATGNYLDSPDTGMRKVDGQAGKDMIWGTIAADQLYGGDGDDWIMGNLGADHIEGGLGNDYITGLGEGADVKGGDGNDIITAASAEYLSIDGPRSWAIPGITADIIWSDVSQHWTAGYNLLQMYQDGSLDFQVGGGVAINTVFSGASALGGGWTYQFSVVAGVFQLKYTHPTLAPNGEAPATSLTHEIDSGYVLAGGVYLSGEASNDNEWRIAA